MIWKIIVFFLLVITLALLIKIFYMRKAIKEIKNGFSDKLNTDTNTPIMLSSHDKLISSLANEINVELKELQKQKHSYMQGDKELKNAITNISHDLRTPLTTICWYLKLLDREEKSETVARQLDIIKNRTSALKQLTEELFRYSVIMSSEDDLKIEPVVINDILRESIASFYAVLKLNNIIPHISIPDNKVVRNVDRNTVSRIFSNLLNNAVKYSDGDLTITLSENGEIQFINHASTLTEVSVGKLFDRFYTVTDARNSAGLGLSISKTLVTRLDGSITANYKNSKLIISIIFQD